MKKGFYCSLLALVLCGCETTTPTTHSNPITQGNVQLHLKKGITTKSDVLEKFGAPNLTTRDGQGREVWSYQKHATKESVASGGLGIAGLIGAGVGGAGVAGASASASSRTMTLIIKFNANDVVEDYDSRSSSF